MQGDGGRDTNPSGTLQQKGRDDHLRCFAASYLRLLHPLSNRVFVDRVFLYGVFRLSFALLRRIATRTSACPRLVLRFFSSFRSISLFFRFAVFFLNMFSEKTTLPSPSTSPKRSAVQMASPRAFATLAAFLVCPLGLILLLLHCGFFGHVRMTPMYGTAQTRVSELEKVRGHLKGPSSDDAPHLRMQFCKAENLRRCKAYPYNQGCTRIDE